MSNYHISDFNADSPTTGNTINDNFKVATLKRPKKKTNPTTINERFEEMETSDPADFEDFKEAMEDLALPEEEFETFDDADIMNDFQEAFPVQNKVTPNIPIERPQPAPTPVENRPLIGGLPRIPITIGKKRKERKVLKKEHTSLQAKNSNFIFVFGYTGSGLSLIHISEPTRPY